MSKEIQLSESEKENIRKIMVETNNKAEVARITGFTLNKVKRFLNQDAGLCSCGKQHLPNLKSCQDCLDKSKAGHRRRFAFRKENALCIFCGKPIDRPDLSRTSCLEHLEKVRHFQTKLKAERMKNHVCVQCEKPLSPRSSEYCEYHLIYHNNKSREHRLGYLVEPVLLRDNYQCVICHGTKPRLEIHHLDCNQSNNTIDNLITLCMTCHRTITWMLMCENRKGLFDFFQSHYQG